MRNPVFYNSPFIRMFGFSPDNSQTVIFGDIVKLFSRSSAVILKQNLCFYFLLAATVFVLWKKIHRYIQHMPILIEICPSFRVVEHCTYDIQTSLQKLFFSATT